MTIGPKSQFAVENVPANFPKETRRLILIPARGDFADIESVDAKALSHHLSAEIPGSWPPKSVSPIGPDAESGWQNFYLTHTAPDSRKIVVGFAGIKKFHAEGTIFQIGCALVPEYHGQHLGEEVASALGQWGITQSGVHSVICDIPTDHIASATSLERAGFSKRSETFAGLIRFELKSSAD